MQASLPHPAVTCCALILAFVGSLPSVQAHEWPLADTLARVKPAVVGVGTHQPTRRPPSRLLGTGFVIGDGSTVVTNAHVVDIDLAQDQYEELVVFSGTGNQGRVVGADVLRVDAEHDLALLKIGERLPAMALATAHEVREGDVYAFTGFPIGAVLGLYPVTHRGMVSSITPLAIPARSSVQLDARKIRRLQNPVSVYQLDGTAYPGNSGSPLYDPATGQVVGILNQVYVKATKEDVLSQPSGISYAVPVRYLTRLLEREEIR
ncbi:S1C family serine protease [Motiliproteus sp. SC1-56]|uniref:S1C family serine protease n=1 Tax=Motiliproteus sp. SC1-56 TaxID=2799565 RepID=UPI001F5D943E|nr:serine protease [Motiliproteus sp. SC1-56]